MDYALFYDNPSSGQAAPPAPSAESVAQAQAAQKAVDAEAQARADSMARLYDKSVPQPAKLEPVAPEVEKTAAQKMFGDTMFAEAESTLVPDANGTPEEVTAARVAVRNELHKVELEPALARSLTEQYLAAMKAPISDEQHETQRVAMLTELNRRFGVADAREKLADVRALLARSPDIAEQLTQSGLDVQLDVIVNLASHARTLRGRGRL